VHQKEQIEKCKLKLLESIVEILVPIQSKLNDANKKRMNVEFDFIN
jgi:tryptophanyl-tRNA synthetase